jgi:hypothetical protein
MPRTHSTLRARARDEHRSTRETHFVLRCHEAVHAGDVDDATPLARLHVRQYSTRREEYSRQIERDDLMPSLYDR